VEGSRLLRRKGDFDQLAHLIIDWSTNPSDAEVMNLKAALWAVVRLMRLNM